ncbi:putative transcriptional activator DEMETER-like [Heracleum sosnowskyi]|uniref:Transcriptional activator DEMETER-like n=1 Tax=Heracleum sosnowskyi TaxID=360622 RepID=A0AAD8HSI2_9APIA|nr:putative transcriptional activator DEMETER-like [Heracleum sosnowskyi]
MSAAASDQNGSMSTITPPLESVFEVKISVETDPNPSETIVLDLADQIQDCEQNIEVPESPKPDSVEQPGLRIHPGKLRTVHQVFELPDSHPLLEEFEERVTDDPCPYLLAIWPTGTMLKAFQQQSTDSSGGDSLESGKCNETNIHPSCRTDDEEIIKGTILIPCRTATRGKFPINGAFFQINEVFADHESSELPVDVPKAWVCNLPKRSLHCAMTATTIFRDATSEEIQYCLSRGYICLRGFQTRQRVVRQLNARFHVSPCAAGNTGGATL